MQLLENFKSHTCHIPTRPHGSRWRVCVLRPRAVPQSRAWHSGALSSHLSWEGVASPSHGVSQELPPMGPSPSIFAGQPGLSSPYLTVGENKACRGSVVTGPGSHSKSVAQVLQSPQVFGPIPLCDGLGVRAGSGGNWGHTGRSPSYHKSSTRGFPEVGFTCHLSLLSMVFSSVV